MPVHNEFHLGKNAILILVVIQLSALLFGLMTLQNLASFNCQAPGQGLNSTPNSATLCALNNQVSGINGTVHHLVNVFACATNSSIPSCWFSAPPSSASSNSTSSCWIGGCPINTAVSIFAFVGNVAFGVISGLGYLIELVGQALFLIIFLLLFFFPSLFSTGAFGNFGILFGILFDGATLIMVFYLLYLLVNRLPWFGKH